MPIQVLPISIERKIVRLGRNLPYEQAVLLSCAEICKFYEPSRSLKWPEDNLNWEEIEKIYLSHIDKAIYNDIVIKFVGEISEKIEWTPEEDANAFLKYEPAGILLPGLLYANMSEHMLPQDILRKITRGYFEVYKISNRITSDRYKKRDPKTEVNKQSKNAETKINEAKTPKEYFEAISSQTNIRLDNLF